MTDITLNAMRGFGNDGRDICRADKGARVPALDFPKQIRAVLSALRPQKTARARPNDWLMLPRAAS